MVLLIAGAGVYLWFGWTKTSLALLAIFCLRIAMSMGYVPKAEEDKAEDRDGSVTVELVFENEEAARAAYEAVNPADLPGGDNAVTFVGVRFTQGQRTRRRHQ